MLGKRRQWSFISNCMQGRWKNYYEWLWQNTDKLEYIAYREKNGITMGMVILTNAITEKHAKNLLRATNICSVKGFDQKLEQFKELGVYVERGIKVDVTEEEKQFNIINDDIKDKSGDDDTTVTTYTTEDGETNAASKIDDAKKKNTLSVYYGLQIVWYAMKENIKSFIINSLKDDAKRSNVQRLRKYMRSC